MEILTGPSIAETHTSAQQWRNLVQDYERNFEQLSDDQKLSKLCSDAGLNIVEIGQYFFILDTEEGPNDMEHFCRKDTLPRDEEKTRAKGWILWLHPKSLQYWNSGRISVSRQNSFLCSNRERNWQVRDRIDGNQGGGRASNFGEICCQSQTTTEARSGAVFRFCRTWKKVDRHKSWELSSGLLVGVKCHDPIATTWWISSSGRWWSSLIWRRLGRIMEEKKSSMVLCNGQLTNGKLCWRKEEDQRKGFNIVWILTLPNTSCTSEHFKDIQEVMQLQDNVLLPKRIYWVHLPRRECSEFNNQKWIDSWRTKSQKRNTFCVFQYNKPVGKWLWYGETPCDLNNPRIAPYKSTRKPLQNTEN